MTEKKAATEKTGEHEKAAVKTDEKTGIDPISGRHRSGGAFVQPPIHDEDLASDPFDTHVPDYSRKSERERSGGAHVQPEILDEELRAGGSNDYAEIDHGPTV